MIPKSLSASSILVSENCMERWKVENFWRTPQASSEPANIGTSVHFALEHFVKAVYLDKTHQWDDVKLLKQFYELGYIDTFGTTNLDTEAFKDGALLVAKWYDLNKKGLPNKVLSVESKQNFPIKTSAGIIPWNYIYDRLDQIDEDTYEVVDYKTIRAYIGPEDLKAKIQPRSYALAAQIMFPEAKRIWVTFDMIRHSGPVGVVFTREENADTYRYIKRAAERIIATDEDSTEETLNPECKWCIKKVTCETLGKANAAGTVHGLPIEVVAQRKLDIDAQILALKYAQEELDKQLCLEAENREEFDFTLGGVSVSITARATRKANSNAIANIVGQELSTKYGNFSMTNIDKMLKSGELGPEKIKAVEEQITKSWSSPSAKVKPLNSFEEN